MVVDISFILLSMLINIVKKVQALNVVVFRCKPVKRKLEVNEKTQVCESEGASEAKLDSKNNVNMELSMLRH